MKRKEFKISWQKFPEEKPVELIDKDSYNRLLEEARAMRGALVATDDYTHLHLGRKKDWDLQYIDAIQEKVREALERFDKFLKQEGEG